MDSILASIILPIYKTNRQYLREAIESILSQTYQNFELLLIIDEDPCYKTKSFIKIFSDKRIITLENGSNKGLVYSLNRGIECAKGKYIFRMDSDDIALDNRIKRQIDFFEKHKDVNVLGTYAQTFGMYDQVFSSSLTNAQIRGELLWKNPLIHPTIAFRASYLKENNIKYSEGDSEDYRLWLDLAFKRNDCVFAVLPEILLKYRTHPNQITFRDKERILNKEKEIILLILSDCNLQLDNKQIELLCLIRQNSKISLSEMLSCIWILHLFTKNIEDMTTKNTFRREYLKGLYKSFRCIDKK